jgi:hypothetical protein
MALDILAPIAEFVGNIIFGIQHWKRQGPFPTISVFVSGLVFLLLGGMSALVVVALAPQWHRIAIVLVVFVGAAAFPLAAQKAGLKLGFLLTPARSVVLATFAAVGSIGALYVANAL